MSTEKTFYICYHANCTDGFGAYWAAQHHLKKVWPGCNIISQACKYGDKLDISPADIKASGDYVDLVILDFSFTPEYTKELMQYFNHVIWVDHHKSAIEAWDKYAAENITFEELEISTYLSRDNSTSGCVLTWEWFCEYHYDKEDKAWKLEAPPHFLELLQDYDLWKFNYKNTLPFKAGLATISQDIATWNELRHPDYLSAIIMRGEAILSYEATLIDSIIASSTKAITIDGVRGLCCNAPGMLASKIGNILAEKSGTFAAVWYENASGETIFSLRSVAGAPDEVDVSVMATAFGGGGHKNAAGFSLSYLGQDSRTQVVLWSYTGHRSRDPSFQQELVIHPSVLAAASDKDIKILKQSGMANKRLEDVDNGGEDSSEE